MEKKKKIVAIFLAVTGRVCYVLFCSFYRSRSRPRLCGENCPICYQISVCENTLKNFSLAVCAVAFAAAFTYTLCRSISVCTNVTPIYTLVSLKVKLTD